MASLPRPSRPSLQTYSATKPPTGPLPSIPIPKMRQSSAASPISPAALSRTGSSSSIPTNGAVNSSSSSIPTSSATPNTTNAEENKTQVRRTISYNSFPRPPAGMKSSTNHSPSSSSSTTPRTSVRGSNPVNGASRSASMGGPHTTTPRSTPAAKRESSSPPAETDESPRGRQRPPSTTSKDKGNVVISVRVRPEKDNTESGDWTVDGKQSLVSFKGKEGGDYVYDNVFSTEDNNAKVYDSSARRLVRRVMEGYNGTVFAYGMTGTGKTYSMQGTATSPGVIPSAITDIFSYIRETPHREFLLRVSYLEIYNEKIHDLLSMPSAGGIGIQTQDEIKLREDSKGNVYATPLKEEIVQSPTQLLRVIARGDHARKTSATQYNIKSSRSHAVVQIVVESRERNAGANVVRDSKQGQVVPGGVRVSTLSLIDLAGSERAAESKERRTEGAHINKSLLTLGTVISKLSGHKDKQGQPTDKDGKHLPYRDSKLTRLLQPALSGNSLISILCTIQLGSSGSSAVAGNHTIETLNTLKFAARARNNIVSHAKKSEESHGNIGDAGSRALLDRYRAEILELRKQLEGKSEDGAKAKSEEEEKQKEEEQNQRHEEQIIEIHLARTALADRIEHLNRLILSSKSTGVNQSRSYSSLSLAHQRMSNFSTTTDGSHYARSIRSSASTITGSPRMTRDSVDSLPIQTPVTPNGDEYEEDYGGVNGDGNATMAAQIRALQADLADKSRYIEDLQRKLAQARRNSRSRVSLMLQNRSLPSIEQGGAEELLREKDAEIAELREQLDDRDRMLSALRSATRKREAVDSSPTVTPASSVRRTSMQRSSVPETNESATAARSARRANRASSDSMGPAMNGVSNRASLMSNRRSSMTSGLHASRSSVTSPLASVYSVESTVSDAVSTSTVTRAHSAQQVIDNITTPSGRLSPRSPRTARKNHGVDEMTRMLDDMIRQKLESEKLEMENTSSPSSVRSNSLNLLAMRNAPVSKRRYSTRANGSIEGIVNPRGNSNITNGDHGSKMTASDTNETNMKPMQNVKSSPVRRRQDSVHAQNQAYSIDSHLDGVSSSTGSQDQQPSADAKSPTSISRTSDTYNRSTAAASQATDALRHLTGHMTQPEESSDDDRASSTGDASTIVNGETSTTAETNKPALQRVPELMSASLAS